MVTKKGEHQDLEGGDSLDGCVSCTGGLYPAAAPTFQDKYKSNALPRTQVSIEFKE